MTLCVASICVAASLVLDQSVASKAGKVFGCPFQLSKGQTSDNFRITEASNAVNTASEQNNVAFICFLQPYGTYDGKLCSSVCAGPCWPGGGGVKTTFCSFVFQ